MTKNEPRVWKLIFSGDCWWSTEHEAEKIGDQVEVVEATALQDAQREIERLNKQHDSAFSKAEMFMLEIANLKARLAVARSALETISGKIMNPTGERHSVIADRALAKIGERE